MVMYIMFARLSLVSQTTKIYIFSDFTVCNTRRVIIIIIIIIIIPLSYISRRIGHKKFLTYRFKQKHLQSGVKSGTITNV
jgi:hypothetical protein